MYQGQRFNDVRSEWLVMSKGPFWSLGGRRNYDMIATQASLLLILLGVTQYPISFSYRTPNSI